MSRFRLNQKGDTIVEVLIAVAVLSAVMGAAYTITNRSLANSLQSQEHSEAQKLAQGQIEQIRAAAATDKVNQGVFDGTKSYCFAVKALTTPTVVNKGDRVEDTSASCRDIGNVNYKVGFKYDVGSKVFTVNVMWDGATGGQDRVSMTYGAYPK